MAKVSKWEKEFSDNFRPNLFEKLIKRLEVSRRDVISEILPKNGDTFIDIACGSGDTIFSIAKRFKYVVGLDIAKNRIKFAKEKTVRLGFKNVKFMNSDFDKGLPLRDKTADIVLCEASLSYFYDLNFILSEVARILKPSGRFVIEVPNYAFFTRRLALLFGFMPKTSSFLGPEDGGALHYFTYASLKETLAQNGFKIELKTNSGVLPSLRKIYPDLLAGDIIYLCKKQK
ncbi:MAG TPA: methyltransferase domain-containing protein [Patescibacteria group bacterium]|nr:methyltransferase domain-containing protein [Patescibacteria group bacterium]